MSKVAEVVVVSHSHEEEELLAKQHYVDPPMPLLGKPVDKEQLVGRNKKAEFALSQLMAMVMADVDEALGRATTIPVGDQLDRIIVSEEQSAHIGRTSSLTGVRKEVTHNLTTIQKALNYRKSALIMMNHNYSKKLVRLIEPIYVNEARSITQRTGDLGAPQAPPSSMPVNSPNKVAPINAKT
ncbi:hypothetical protein B484DRAFT_257954 [Ochromonadaceae sp. CCMP2298]|nr:hypothetical protein B484DRAFT_257954 [Ochromonadaceae sp. CCMP2298]|mmetsp:Transcript_13541/g.30330  ORF Transcript_13541/g.30330 Transcript_13541/m.30330 type:complete len:183 (-) Transcript_13541:1882-2430(-)